MQSAAPMISRMLDRTFLRPGGRVCAAVSGGADSVAMLLLLQAENALPRNALGVGLSAVHVHHGLRGTEADADLAFVESLCTRLHVPLHVHHASVPERMERARAAGRVETVEEAARAVRYAVFRELLAEGMADSVSTAHTLDDQAETVLMKLLRGAWTEGLSGIFPSVAVEVTDLEEHGAVRDAGGSMNGRLRPWGIPSDTGRRGRIVRPLLGVRHADLRAFLEEQGQPWREDSSNSDEAFTRNRIRHRLIPALREFNPGIDGTLANLAVLAREEETRWATELGRILPHLLLPGKPVRGGGRAVGTASGELATVAIELERLRPMDSALRRRVLRAAARSLGARLSFDDTERLLELSALSESAVSAPGIRKEARTGGRLHLGNELRVERTARELRFYRAQGS